MDAKFGSGLPRLLGLIPRQQRGSLSVWMCSGRLFPGDQGSGIEPGEHFLGGRLQSQSTVSWVNTLMGMQTTGVAAGSPLLDRQGLDSQFFRQILGTQPVQGPSDELPRVAVLG